MDTISIYEAIGRNLGDIDVQGQVASMTATSIDSSVFIHPLDDQTKGQCVYIFSGAGAGQSRTVVDSEATNKRVMIGVPWTTTPSTNSQFMMFKHFEAEDYENALNRSIGWVRLRYLDNKVATMELVGTQYEYAVPSGFEYIRTLRLVPSGHTDYRADVKVKNIFEISQRYWWIEPNPQGSYCIVFDSRMINLSEFKEKWVHVIGQVKPDFAGTEISEELQEYIINASSMIMASQRMNEKNEWTRKFAMFKDNHKGLEEYITSHRHGRRVGG